MKLVFLDMAKLSTKEAFHAALKEKLSLPEYYGGNLDALHDLLSEKNAASVGLLFENCSLASEEMKPYLDSCKALLADLEQEGAGPFYRFFP